MTTAQIVLLLANLGVGLWAMHKIGQALTEALEALAAVAAVFVTVWLLVKGAWWVARQVVRHWRTSLTTVAVLASLHWWGALSLLITLAMVVAGLLVWRWLHRDSFEPRAADTCAPGGSGGWSTPAGCRAGCAPAGSPSPTRASRSPCRSPRSAAPGCSRRSSLAATSFPGWSGCGLGRRGMR
jgi:S-DNA-T family DNA segregation ATPase FtsK/SpoIIIE